MKDAVQVVVRWDEALAELRLPPSPAVVQVTDAERLLVPVVNCKGPCIGDGSGAVGVAACGCVGRVA